MDPAGKKLGVLISSRPDQASFRHGVRFAAAALGLGCEVYLYCIDEATAGVSNAELQSLKARGLRLYACAYGAQRHRIPLDDRAVFAGLTVVSDIIGSTDRFVSFN